MGQEESEKKIQLTSLPMSEIAKLPRFLIVNQPMLVVPPEVVETAGELQHDCKKAAEFLENCYLVYRDCTLNHVISGVALQCREGVYQWLQPAEFSWGDTEKIKELALQVKTREAEKFSISVEDSVPVYEIPLHGVSAGRLLYYKKRPQLDKKVIFLVPPKLFSVDAMDWTRITAGFLYRPALKIKEFTEGDELLEHQGRILLLEILNNLAKATPY